MAIHGDMSQDGRNRAFKRFKDGEVPLLIATGMPEERKKQLEMLVFVTPRHQDKTGIAYARVTHSCMHALCFFSMHSYLYTQEFCFGKSFITASILHALIRTIKNMLRTFPF